MVFLNIKDKTWVVGKLSIPVIEDIPMKDLKWFRDKSKEALTKEQAGEITQLEALNYDDEWWEKICMVGLATPKDDIIDSGLTEPKFRELMAEVYTFLAIFGNVEEAKLSPLYSALTPKKETLDSKTTQN